MNRQSVQFPAGAMYRHNTLRVNYTTYDVRRSFNVINPRSKHHFIMLPSGDDLPDHPYWYAKVLGIYHINAVHSGNLFSQRIEYLWVRWLEIVEPGSWEQSRLDRVQYVPASSYRERFGFVNPACVLRACHLIPAFAFGRIDNGDIPAHSVALDDAEDGDWRFYYVNRYGYLVLLLNRERCMMILAWERFVDRDMFMRYWGGGPGHIDWHTSHNGNTEITIDDDTGGNNDPTGDNDLDEWEVNQGSDAGDSESSEL